jgi:tRNA U38,U39,U40 pseudouridine synthase TruA
MKYYKSILQYDGSDRMGFQWQERVPTIQGDLNQTLNETRPCPRISDA